LQPSKERFPREGLGLAVQLFAPRGMFVLPQVLEDTHFLVSVHHPSGLSGKRFPGFS
jgi:hypothetical protein